MATSPKLEELRKLMGAHSLAAYIVPSDDAHQSEYVAKFQHRREYISGFTGSAGTAVITEKEALLWTDGRYFLQAEHELDVNWKLMKDRQPDTIPIETYLANNLPKDAAVGVDPTVLSRQTAKKWGASIKLTYVKENLIDLIWHDRPAAPSAPVIVLPLKYSGNPTSAKVEQVRTQLEKEKADALVISALDEVAWTLNIRGTDIEYNPVVISYVIITKDDVRFFVDLAKITPEVTAHLDGVRILPYEQFFENLKALNDDGKRVWIDPKSSMAIYNIVAESNIFEKASPVTLAKALKNAVELEGMRLCHLRDGAALIEFLAWLEAEHQRGNTDLDEVSVSDRLELFRREKQDFFSLSFPTIAGSGPNGAIIHYRPEKGKCAKLQKNQMFLVDSGAQYWDGTTDVTRTVHYGQPTQHEIDCYTKVLQGHIALATAVFPKDTTTGKELDSITRMPLWRAGLEYAHGTGHGVGAFLNVHEGPQGISMFYNPLVSPFMAGMTITNEPGYYEAGNFGIRIENVMITEPAPTKFNDGKFLRLKNLTLVPYDANLIDVSALSNLEIAYVNQYHEQCLAQVGPLLQHNKQAQEWLQRATEPI